jgi:vitamin B12 transporter
LRFSLSKYIVRRALKPIFWLFIVNAFTLPLAWAEAGAGIEVELSTVSVYAGSWDTLSKQTYNGDDIRERFNTVEQFLNSVSGLQVQHSGGLGDPILLSVRGGASNQTTVLIDGIKLNNAQGGSYDLSTIPLAAIERVEISQRGSNGGQYDQAIGGTINIITRTDYRQKSLQLGLGSYGYSRAAYHRPLTPKLSLYVDTERSNNNYDYPVPTPWDGSERYSSESLNNAEFYRHQAHLAFREELFITRLRWLKKNKQIPDYFRNAPDNNARLSKSEWALQFENSDVNKRDGLRLDWHIAHQNTDERFSDPKGYIGLGEDDDHYQSNHSEINLQPVWQQENYELNAAVNLERDDYQSRYLNDDDSSACLTYQGSCDQNAIQRTINISARASYQPTELWQLSASTFHRSLSSQNKRAHAAPAQRQHNEEDFSGASASVTRLFSIAQIQLSARKSVRIPSLYERYGDRGLMQGNDDLESEIATTVSLDTEWYLGMQTARISLFKRHLDNAIVPVYDSRGIGRYENTTNANLTGLEATLESQFNIQKVRVTPVIGLSQYTSETESKVRSFDQQELSGIYQKRYTIAINFDYQRHKAGLNYELAGDLYLDRSNINEGDTREIIAAHYGYEQQSWNANLTVSNLANNRFRDYSNRPVRGRTINLNTEFKF